MACDPCQGTGKACKRSGCAVHMGGPCPPCPLCQPSPPGALRRFVDWLGYATIMDPDPEGMGLSRALREWDQHRDAEAYKRGVRACIDVVAHYADLSAAQRLEMANALRHLL